jgi:hypothetical protein
MVNLRSCSVLARVVIVALAFHSLGVAAAVEPRVKPPDTPKLTEAARRGWLRARIVSGRIAASATRLGTMNDAAKTGQREEQVSIRATGRELTVRYECSDPDEKLLIEIKSPEEIRIRRTPEGDSRLVPAEFRQTEKGPLELTVGPAEGEQVYQAATLWHLLIVHPKVCREHLLPLLHVLDEQWNLGETAREVEAALVQAVAEGDLPDPRRWAELVKQLGDERFSRREAADRELRALGRVVYTYLEQLDPSRLDAEQHYRVRRIVMSLAAGMENDTPQEIASWLAGDPAVWLALLARDDEATRRLAAERLGALLGGPIDFDPAADPETRAKQIDGLRPRVESKR